jgi:uncharacterized protein (DUF362 family)
MNRRDFIKTGAAAALASGLLPLDAALGDAPAETVLPGSVVWEAEGAPANTVPALFSSLSDLGEIMPDGLEGSTVLLKPNLCLPHPPAMATTTSPDLIDALCRYFTDKKAKRVIVADHTLQKAGDFENMEAVKVADKYPGVKMVLANEQRYFQPVEVEGKVLKRTELLKLLSRADLVVNVATAKHHSAASVSLATKNLMGVIWDRAELHSKMDLHQAIADLALAVRPGLNIIDAGKVLLDNGPTGPGPVKEDGRLFAAYDIVALDSVVVSRYNFGGKTQSAGDIAHLLAAHEAGAGEIDPKKIRVEKLKV